MVHYRRSFDGPLATALLLTLAFLIAEGPSDGIFSAPCTGRGTVVCELGVSLEPYSVAGHNPVFILFIALVGFCAFYVGKRFVHNRAISRNGETLVVRSPLTTTEIEWTSISSCSYQKGKAGLHSFLNLYLADGQRLSLPNVDTSEAEAFCDEVDRLT